MEIEFKKIELGDQELISHFFAHHTSRSCERTFTNVYVGKVLRRVLCRGRRVAGI